jgi:hypothetical protein
MLTTRNSRQVKHNAKATTVAVHVEPSDVARLMKAARASGNAATAVAAVCKDD